MGEANAVGPTSMEGSFPSAQSALIQQSSWTLALACGSDVTCKQDHLLQNQFLQNQNRDPRITTLLVCILKY